MKTDYWLEGEVQYRFVEKRIIIEEYLGTDEQLKTIKFFCFNGEPKVAYLSINEDRYIDYYDLQFNKLPYSLPGHLHYPNTIEKPKNYDEMIKIARELSKGFPFVRVDLYDVAGRGICFSEMTFLPTGGYMRINPPSVIENWNNWL